VGRFEVLGILIFWNSFDHNPASGNVIFCTAPLNVSCHNSAGASAEIACGTFESRGFFMCYEVLVKICHGSRPITAKRTLIDEAFDQFGCTTAATGAFEFFVFPFQL
jgi:hypothetical protein